MDRRRLVTWSVILGLGLPVDVGLVAAASPTADPRLIPLTEFPKEARRALIVGAADYQPPWLRLQQTTNDVVGFERLLKEQWGFSADQVLCIADDVKDYYRPSVFNLTRNEIIPGFLRNVNSASVVVVLFAGHGLRFNGQDWFLPKEAVEGNLTGTSFCISKLWGELEDKQPRRAVMFIDACRRLYKDRGDRGVKLGPGPEAPEKQPRPPGLSVMYACAPDQVSREYANLGHGVFTYYLLKALGGDRDAAEKGDSGLITFDSLLDYLRRKVPACLVEKGDADPPQVPTGYSESGRIVFARAVQIDSAPSNRDARVASLLRDGWRTFGAVLKPDLDLAEQKAREALGIEPNSAEAFLLLARIYRRRNQLDDAISNYMEAWRCDRNYPDVADELEDALAQRRKSMTSFLPGASPSAALARIVNYEDAPPWPFLASGDRTPRLFLTAAAPSATDARSLADAEIAAIARIVRDPADAQARLTLARVYARQARPNDAIRQYQEALLLDPALPTVRQEIDRVLEQKGPADPWRLANEALQLVEAGRFGEAEGRAREVVARAPNNAEAHFALGRVFHSQQRYDEALREYDRARVLDPTLAPIDPAAKEAKRVQAQQGVHDRLREAYARVSTDPASAEARARAVLALAPEDPLGHLVLGLVAQGKQRPDLALGEFSEALRVQPGLEEASRGVREALAALPRRDVDALLQDAAEALRARPQRLLDAQGRARAVLGLEPDNVPARLLLGQVFEARELFGDAVVAYEEVVQRAPGNAAAQASRQTALSQQRKQDAARLAETAHQYLIRRKFLDAREKARAALDRDDANVTAHAVLGNALLWLEQRPSGLEALRRAQALAGKRAVSLVHDGLGTDQWLQALPHLLLAEQQQQAEAQAASAAEKRKLRRASEQSAGKALKPLRQAEKEFLKARDADPEDIIAHNNLGAVYHTLARFDTRPTEHLRKAVAEYQAALARDEYHVAYYNLGNVYLAWGRTVEGRDPQGAATYWLQAEEAFRKATTLYEENSGSQAQLAFALLKQDQQEKRDEAVLRARKAKEQGLMDHPVFKELRERFGISV